MVSTKGSTRVVAREERLTKAELLSWTSFTAAAWAPFREAWIGRGLHYAPAGGDSDDDTSQRGLLWQIADARPFDLARWVREAPLPTPSAIIDYVLARFHEIRAEVDAEDAAIEQARPLRSRSVFDDPLWICVDDGLAFTSRDGLEDHERDEH